MKLKQLKLKNFRGYNSDTYLEVSDLTALIGKNDAGKSTILEALEIFFNNKLLEYITLFVNTYKQWVCSYEI